MSMGLCHIVVIVIALLADVDTLSTGVLAEVGAKSSHLTHSIVSEANVIRERLLRINRRDEGVNEINEERAGGLLSKVSNFLKENNVIRWADAYKSDDFVKQKLDLNGLSGHALTGHTNYKLFEKFVRIKQSNRLNAWKVADASTFAVWRELGLGNINTWDDLMRAADTDAFKLYQRYADSFDNNAVIKAAFERKDVPVLISDTSWTERIARMVNWKANEKSESYVMTALGFDKLSPAALEANKNGKTFLVYWLLKFDNSLNVDRQNTKDILKKLMELEKMSPAEMTRMKNKDALDRDQQRTKILLKKLLGLENLSPAEMVANDKYQTYKYVYGLIKQNKIDDYTSTLLERLTLDPKTLIVETGIKCYGINYFDVDVMNSLTLYLLENL